MRSRLCICICFIWKVHCKYGRCQNMGMMNGIEPKFQCNNANQRLSDSSKLASSEKCMTFGTRQTWVLGLALLPLASCEALGTCILWVLAPLSVRWRGCAQCAPRSSLGPTWCGSALNHSAQPGSDSPSSCPPVAPKIARKSQKRTHKLTTTLKKNPNLNCSVWF